MSASNNILILPLVLASFIFSSCGTPKGGIFRNQSSAHDLYSKGLKEVGLHTTQMGSLWLTAANHSLAQPLSVTIPYKETGYFHADKPRAAGYRFSAKRGEKLNIIINTIPTTGLKIFTELWEMGEAGSQPKFLADLDTLKHNIVFEIEKEGTYIVRVQPELLKGVEYTLVINAGPSLAFPVQSSGNPRMSSFWGASRDGGIRKHEGVDIVAKFRTPALAAADGRVTRVQEGGLGGKVVYLRPAGRNYSLYYAHLDSQSVSPGQEVRSGDIIGLIGNTGNAEKTVPHLHFGIYTNSGATDPLPFIDKARKVTEVTLPIEGLHETLRTGSNSKIYISPDTKSQVLLNPVVGQVVNAGAATMNFYRIVLPDGSEGFIPGTSVTSRPIKKQKMGAATRLLDSPSILSAAKMIIPAGQEVDIKGIHDNFYFVKFKNDIGWILN